MRSVVTGALRRPVAQGDPEAPLAGGIALGRLGSEAGDDAAIAEPDAPFIGIGAEALSTAVDGAEAAIAASASLRLLHAPSAKSASEMHAVPKRVTGWRFIRVSG